MKRPRREHPAEYRSLKEVRSIRSEQRFRDSSCCVSDPCPLARQGVQRTLGDQKAKPRVVRCLWVHALFLAVFSCQHTCDAGMSAVHNRASAQVRRKGSPFFVLSFLGGVF